MTLKRFFPLLILLVGILPYLNGLDAPFIFDDTNAIPHNARIRSFLPIGELLAGAPKSAVSGRPVANISLALNYAAGGLDVRGFHLTNLALHLLTAMTLFGLIRRTLLSPNLQPHYEHAAPWIALIVALLWTIHPIHTEVINYTVQRTEILMGLSYTLTLYAIARAETAPKPTRWHLGAILACAAGMGSKEVMVSAPVIALLYDRIFYADGFADLFRRRGRLHAALVATWIVLITSMATAPRDETLAWMVKGSSADGGPTVTPWANLLTETGVILHYLKTAYWPHPLVMHYHWPIAKSPADVAAPIAVMIALLAATAWACRKHPPIAFLGLVFFAVLAPTSTILPIVTEVAADRRMYLPLASVILLTTLFVHSQFHRWQAKRTAQIPLAPLAPIVSTALTLGLAVTFIVLGWRRNHDYRSEIAIWSDNVAKQPDDPIGHLNLGTAFGNQGNLQQAIVHYAESVKLRPWSALGQYNLANAYLQQGKPLLASPHITQALRLDPNYPDAHSTMGILLAQRNEFDQAEKHFAHALRIRPNSADYNVNMGNLHAAKGRFDLAIENFSRALERNPAHLNALNGLAFVYAQSGQFDQALITAQAALRSAAAADRTEQVRLLQDRIRTYQVLRDNSKPTSPGSQPAPSSGSP